MPVIDAPLVGRTDALAELDRALAATAAGRGSCLIVASPAGTGKSRVLDVACAQALRLGMSVAPGRATILDRVAPLTTLMTALRLCQPTPVEHGQRGGQDDSCFWMIERLGEAMADHARTRPLVIAIDDAQWTDELSALALQVLVPTLSGVPILWLLARRPVPVSSAAQKTMDWLVAKGATELHLGPLSDEQLAELCRQMLGAELDATVLAIVARSGGNPFLVEALLTALTDAGQILVAGGTAVAVTAELPASFVRSVDQWLYSLSPVTRRLLQVGSVLGRPFSLHAAAEIMSCPAIELLACADEAVRSGTVVDCGTDLAFRHDLLREAVYLNLSGPARSVLHYRAAAVARRENRPPMEVAEHLVRSGYQGDDRAVAVLREVAAEVAASSPSTAADLILRVMTLLDEGHPQHRALAAEAVRLLASAGRLTEALDVGERALHAGLEPATKANLLLGLAEAVKHAGRNTDVVAYTAQALAPDLPAATRAQLLAIQAHGLLYLDDLDGADRAAAQAWALGIDSYEYDAAVFGIAARSVVARAQGRLHDALDHARQAVDQADAVGGTALHRHPRLWLGRALASLDRFDEAERAYTVGRREAEQLGTAWSQPLWHFYRASLCLATGRLEDALAEAEAGIRIADQLAATQLSVPLHALAAQVAIHRFDLVASRQYIARTQQLLADGVSAASEDLTWALAQLQEASDEPLAAMQTLADLFRRLPQRRLLLADEPGSAGHLVRLALRTGARRQAEAVVIATRDLERHNPDVASLQGAMRHAEGLLNADLTSLRSAVEHYRGSPRPLARGSALEDTAVAEQATGHRRQAIQLLEEALGEYDHCGAWYDCARVQKRLRSLGVRGRARETRHGSAKGWGSLTRSELKVVQLVAEGMTNREVANRLFLSPHTIDSHLRHAFTKLGVNSRTGMTRLFVVHTAQQAPPA